MKTLVLTAFMLALSGCAAIKPAADAGVAVVQFPQCRVALQAYLPDKIEAELVIQWENIDTAYNEVIKASNGNLDMTLQRAIMLANLPTTADLIEQDFMAIVDRTIEYQQSSGIQAPQFLRDCNTLTQAGWLGIRENEDVATVSEFLRAAAPYAKLVPLLL